MECQGIDKDTVLKLLLYLTAVRRGASVMDSCSVGASSPVHNDSFSEDDEGLLQSCVQHIPDDTHDPNAKFNRSWIK